MPGSKYVENSTGENRWEKPLFVSQPQGALVPLLRTGFCNHPRSSRSDQGWALLTDPQHHFSRDRDTTWAETQWLQPREQLCLCKQISQRPNERSEQLILFSSPKNTTGLDTGRAAQKPAEKSSAEVFVQVHHL